MAHIDSERSSLIHRWEVLTESFRTASMQRNDWYSGHKGCYVLNREACPRN